MTEKMQTSFILNAWETPPTPEQIASDLERIAGMLREGYTSGEAMVDEDYAGRGWWYIEGELDDR